MPDRKIIDLDGLKKFRQETDKRYVIEGEYSPNTRVGKSDLAKGIESERQIEDADIACPPIVMGTAGGGSEIQSGFSKFTELRGNSVNWNQHFNIANSNQSTTKNDVVMTDNRDGTYTFNGTASADTVFQIGITYMTVVAGHKYLLRGGATGGSISTYYMTQNSSGYNDYGEGITYSQPNNNYGVFIAFVIKSGVQVDNIKIKPELFDLTDIYSAGKEPTTVKEFDRDYPKPSYARNTGTLLSSKTNKLISVGKNQFDGELEVGSISNVNGSNTDNTNKVYLRSKNYIRVIPNQAYKFSYENISSFTNGLYIYTYDINKTFIERVWWGNSTTSQTNLHKVLGNNVCYIRFCFSNYGGDDIVWTNAKVQVRIYWGAEDSADYDVIEEYKKQEVTLPNIDLRSVGSVYDVLYQNGTGKKRVHYIKFTDLNWVINTASGENYRDCFWGTLPSGVPNAKAPSGYSDVANILCNNYKKGSRYGVEYGESTADKVITIRNSTTLMVQDSQYNDNLAGFLSANANTYIQYELVEEQDITHAGWTELVDVDNLGTLEFTSEQTIQVPQAYFIEYTVNLVEFLDTAYVVAEGDANNLATKSYVTQAMSGIDLTNYVDLTSAQTITGVKTFDEIDINVGTGKVGKITNVGGYYLGIKFNNDNMILLDGAYAGGAVNMTNLLPLSNNSRDIGSSASKWKDGYFAGQVYAKNTPNEINATDIVSNTLTQAQYDLITNGKPTLIKGIFTNNTFVDSILLSPNSSGNGVIIGYQEATNNTVFAKYNINASKVISTNMNAQIQWQHASNKIRVYGSEIDITAGTSMVLNGLTLPSNPPSTGTFVLKCVNGTLTWVQE